MTDPIADLLTRIRNAAAKRHEKVTVPASTIKVAILDILQKRHFIKTWQFIDASTAPSTRKPVQKDIEIGLRYLQNSAPAIRNLKRVSASGCRIYHKADRIRPVLGGRGVAIYSTSKGVVSGEQARKLNLGGELLCQVW